MSPPLGKSLFRNSSESRSIPKIKSDIGCGIDNVIYVDFEIYFVDFLVLLRAVPISERMEATTRKQCAEAIYYKRFSTESFEFCSCAACSRKNLTWICRFFNPSPRSLEHLGTHFKTCYISETLQASANQCKTKL